ncbi:hypothetical protein BC833DRAFT_74025, partial [Globomyces pollinis-pini]
MKPIGEGNDNNNTESVFEYSTTDIDEIYNDSNRLQMLTKIRDTLVENLINSTTEASIYKPGSDNDHPSSPSNIMKCKKAAYIRVVGSEVENWVVKRLTLVTNYLKFLRKGINNSNLCKALENLNWAELGMSSTNMSTDEIDGQIWNRYMIQVKQTKTTMPSKTGDDYNIMNDVKRDALKHFQKVFREVLESSAAEDIVKGFYYSIKLSGTLKIVELFLQVLKSKLSIETLTKDIFPNLILLCIFSKKSCSLDILDLLLESSSKFLTSNTVSTILEFCVHTAHTKSLLLALRFCDHKVTAEGLLTGLLSTSVIGNKQIYQLLHLRMQDMVAKSSKKTDRILKIIQGRSISDIGSFSLPFIYIFITAATASTHTVQIVLPELLEYITDYSVQTQLINGGITKLMHQRFKDGLFNMASELNHSNVVSILAENNWLPVNLKPAVYQAVNQGHQKILHFLLELLLSPDPKIKTVSSAIPLYFRKSNVLRTLPYIASRFPQEASWFLDEMSYIPIPACVPISSDRDALVRPKLVKGIQ